MTFDKITFKREALQYWSSSEMVLGVGCTGLLSQCGQRWGCHGQEGEVVPALLPDSRESLQESLAFLDCPPLVRQEPCVAGKVSPRFGQMCRLCLTALPLASCIYSPSLTEESAFEGAASLRGRWSKERGRERERVHPREASKICFKLWGKWSRRGVPMSSMAPGRQRGRDPNLS